MISGIPPTLVAIVGTPAAIDSSSAVGNASALVGWISTSTASSTASTSSTVPGYDRATTQVRQRALHLPPIGTFAQHEQAEVRELRGEPLDGFGGDLVTLARAEDGHHGDEHLVGPDPELASGFPGPAPGRAPSTIPLCTATTWPGRSQPRAR